MILLSKLSSLLSEAKTSGGGTSADEEICDTFSEMSLDDFSGSLGFDVLRDVVFRRAANIEALFNDAAAKIKNPEDSAASELAIHLRGQMKGLFAKQKVSLLDIRLSKEHLRVLANQSHDGMESAAAGLRNYLTSAFKEAWERDRMIVDAITKYEELESMDFISDNESLSDEAFDTPDDDASVLFDDADKIHWPADQPPFDEAYGQLLDRNAVHTRRLIMSNLPVGISPAQVLKGVQGWGGILGVTMINPGKLTGGKASAILEFNWASSANLYSTHAQTTPINYIDSEGKKHHVRVEKIPTRSYPISSINRPIRGLEVGQWASGRVLMFSEFPKQGVWFFVELVGTMNVIDVSYTPAGISLGDGTLNIEFTSTFHAGRARRLVEQGKLVYYRLGGMRHIHGAFCNSDLMDMDLKLVEARNVGYIPIDHIALKWDTAPWNLLWPTTIKDSDIQIPRNPGLLAPNRVSSSVEFNAGHSMDHSGIRYFQGNQFTVVGGTIRIFLLNGTWIIARQEQIGPLMTNTLHNPHWEGFWDLYFKNNGWVNARKLDVYRRISEHRREHAAKNGQPGCECAYCDIKKSAVPAVVQEFLSTAKYEVVDAGHAWVGRV